MSLRVAVTSAPGAAAGWLLLWADIEGLDCGNHQAGGWGLI